MYSGSNLQRQTTNATNVLTSSAIIRTGSKTTNGSSSSTSKIYMLTNYKLIVYKLML